MIIADCLNQAKRILEKNDDVLYRASPELLVESTYTTIRQLHGSEQCQDFANQHLEQGEAPESPGDAFV